MRDSIVFYRSFYEAICELPEEHQLSAVRAILEYGLNGVEQASGTAKAMLMIARPVIDANNKRYENGKKGGRPKANKNRDETETKPKKNQSETKQEPYVNVNVNDNVNVKRFKAPTLDEVRTYCEERGNNVDPQLFIDYYEARGWKLKSGQMKDWKAAVRTWERRNKESKFNNSPARTYDMNELEIKLRSTN